MSQHRAISGGNHRFAGGLLLGALASGALAVASLGSAGAANATCASFSGLHNGRGCETTDLGDIAIGLGPRTTVRASGGFNTSIAVGGRFVRQTAGCWPILSSSRFSARRSSLPIGRLSNRRMRFAI